MKGVPTLRTLFPDGKSLDPKFVKPSAAYKKKPILKESGIRTKARLARRVFRTFLWIVLKRLANGDLFMLPGNSGAYMTIKSIPDNEVRKLRQMGKYQDIDIVKSAFKIPRFVLDFGPTNPRWDAQIYVPKELEDLAFRNAEQGKLHYTEHRKTQ